MDTQPFVAKGDTAFANMEKINSGLFTMTYGSLVMHLIQETGNLEEVNQKLEKIGYNMGQRMTDELLAKAKISHCQNFEHTANVIALVGFKMYLGVEVEVRDWSEDKKSFTLRLNSNPLNDFVEIPAGFENLVFCNLLCGIIRGGLEMVNMKVNCKYVTDSLHDPETEYDEVRVTLESVIQRIFEED